MSYQILLVDDDTYFRDEFKEFMHEFDVIEARNGEEAISILKKPNNIDLIILDEQLPTTTGTEILEQINTLSPATKKIMLTGYGSKDVAVEAMRNKAEDYFEKPLNSQTIDKIRKILFTVPTGKKSTKLSGIEGKIEQAKHFAQRNYDKKLTLNAVANEICLSPKYLSRIFKEKTGMSFVDYKLHLRIEKAKSLLRDSGKTIEEISYLLGYQNPESFGKVFRKLTKLTPREYRNKQKALEKSLLSDKIFQEEIQKKELVQTIRKVRKEARRNQKQVQKTKSKLVKTEKVLEKEKHFADLGRLASVVAHEVRRPINNIQMAIWNIQKKSNEPSIKKNIECIEQMIEESEQIISNLLSYAKIRSPELKTINFVTFLKECVDSFSQTYTHHQLKIVINTTSMKLKRFACDPLQMKQVLFNLLSNSYESFGDKRSGKITIDAKSDKNNLEIVISDNGKGISKSELQHVFEPFFSSKHKGTGLGLSICKQIISLHNGNIQIKSKVSQGTSIYIQLPY